MPNCSLKLSSNLYVKQRFVVKKLSSEPYSPVIVSTSCLAATYDRRQRWRLHALFYALRAWCSRHRCLISNPLEFEGLESRVVQLLPNSKIFDGFTLPDFRGF